MAQEIRREKMGKYTELFVFNLDGVDGLCMGNKNLK